VKYTISKFLIITSFFILRTVVAQFPMEESWRVDFRIECNNFTLFQDENSTNYLVALENSVAIIDEGEIIWTSEVVGTTVYPAMIDFDLGNGNEVMVSSYTDTLGYITVFSGDDYEDRREIVVGDKGELREGEEYYRWDTRKVRYIADLNADNPDSLQEIVFNRLQTYDYYDGLSAGRGYNNQLFIYSLTDEEIVMQERLRFLRRFQTIDYDEDGELELIGGGSNFSIDYDRAGDSYSSYCTILIISSNLETVGSIVLMESGGDYYPGVEAPIPNFNGMAIGEVREGEQGVFANYSVSDTLYIAKAAFDSPEEISYGVINSEETYNAVHLYDQNVNDERVQIIICISTRGQIVLINAVTLEVIEFIDGFPNGHIMSYLGNFDEDANYELAYLTDDALYYYDIGELIVPDRKKIMMPINFSILSSYPNPFNSTTIVTYGLPMGGIVSLQVYNPLGEHVSTLYEGFQPAGVYSTSLVANNLPTGLYFVRMEASEQVFTQKVMLIR